MPSYTREDLELMMRISGQVDPSLPASVRAAREQLEQLNSTATYTPTFLKSLNSAASTDIMSGILKADVVEEFFSAIRNGFDTVMEKAGEFRDYVLDIVNMMQVSANQIEVLFGNANKFASPDTAARDAIEYARQTALEAPFVKFQDSVTAIRQLTAAGLDYTRWLRTVQNTAAATTNSLDDMGDRIKSVTHAFANIAAGATGIGLRALRQAGINVREAGIEFNKSGEAIGSTEEILRKLETYLNTRFDGALVKLNSTFPAILQNVQDLAAQLTEAFFTPAFEPFQRRAAEAFDSLILKTDEFGVNGAEKMRAFFSVLGDMAGSGMEQLIQVVADGFNQVAGPPMEQRLAEGGARIILAFADGIVQGAIYVLQAVSVIAQTIANFLVGFSPPKEGPLSEIDQGGTNVIDAWVEGLEAAASRAEATADSIAGRVANSLQRGSTPNLADVFGGPQPNDLLARALPSVGSLNGIQVAGAAAAQAYIGGFRTGFDISPIKSILSGLEKLLQFGIDTKQIAESSFGPYMAGLQELLYRAALEIQEFGAVAQATLDQVSSSFGVLAESAVNILNIMGALADIGRQIDAAQAVVDQIQSQIDAYDKLIDAAEKEVKNRQGAVKAADDVIDGIEKRIRAVQLQIQEFELATAEIPDRFTRGRRREFDLTLLRLNQEKELATRQKEAAQARVDAARAEVERLRELQKVERDRLKDAQAHVKELQKQQRALQDLLKMEQQRMQLILDQVEAADKEAKKAAGRAGAGLGNRGFFDPNIGLAATGLAKQFDDLKNKTREWLEQLAPEALAKLRADFAKLKEIVGSFFDGPESDSVGGRIKRSIQSVTTYFKELWDILSGPGSLTDKIKDLFFWMGKDDPNTENKWKLWTQLVNIIGVGIQGIKDFGKVSWEILTITIPDAIRTLTETWPNQIGAFFNRISEKVKTILGPQVFNAIKIAFGPVGGWILSLFVAAFVAAGKEIGTWLVDLGIKFGRWFASFGKNAAGSLSEITREKLAELSQLWEGLKAQGGAAWDWLKTRGSDAWEWIKARANDTWTSVQSWGQTALTNIQSWADQTAQWVNARWDDIKNWAQAVWDEIWAKVSAVLTDVMIWASDTQISLNNSWEQVRAWVLDVWQQIWSKVDEVLADIWGWAQDTKDWLTQQFSEVRDNIIGVWQAIGTAIDTYISGPLNRLLDKIAEAIRNLKKLIGLQNDAKANEPAPSAGGDGAASGFEGTGGEVLGEYATGGIVGKTGKYILHANEVVLNQRQQANVLHRMAVAGSAGGFGPSVQIQHVWQVVPDLEDRLDLENRMERVTLDTIAQVFQKRGVVRR